MVLEDSGPDWGFQKIMCWTVDGISRLDVPMTKMESDAIPYFDNVPCVAVPFRVNNLLAFACACGVYHLWGGMSSPFSDLPVSSVFDSDS